MSTLKRNALRVAVHKALIDAIGEALKDARADTNRDLQDAYRSLGVKSLTVTLPDGTEVGTVSITQPRARIDVDDAKFTRWVKSEHPDQLEPVVRPAFRDAAVSRLAIAGDQVIDQDGQIVEWARVLPGGEPSTFSIRFAGPAGQTGRQAIADAWATGQLDDVAPGPKTLSERSA